MKDDWEQKLITKTNNNNSNTEMYRKLAKLDSDREQKPECLVIASYLTHSSCSKDDPTWQRMWNPPDDSCKSGKGSK